MAHPTPDVLALVALGEDVDPEVLEHIGGCQDCFAEIGALQQVVAIGRSLTPEDRLSTPHPRVWAQISTNLDHGRVVPLRGSVDLLQRPAAEPGRSEPAPLGDGTTDELAARRRPGSRRWTTVALVAAVALVVGLGGGFALKSLLGSGEAVVSSTQLNALPQWPGANGTASIENGPNGQRTLVVTMDLPATVSIDGTLEVWMSDTRARDMLPMGTMTGPSARFPIPSTVDVVTHPIVDVSLEPRNDTDPAHSDTSVVRGRLNV